MQKKRLIKIAIIIGAISIAAFGGYKAITTQKNKPIQSLTENNQIEYVVQKGNILNSVSGSGSVTPSDERTIKSEINGIVENILVKEGDVVHKDQELITLKSNTSGNSDEIESIKEKLEESKSQLNELYTSKGKLNVYAKNSGVIKELNLKVGANITENQEVGFIEETEYIYAQSYFFANYLDKIKVGDKASIFISDFMSEYEGEIVSINYLPTQFGGGTFGHEVIAKIKNPGGMSEGNITQITVKKDDGDIESVRAGKMQKNKTESIFASISGKVKELKVNNGQQVNKGDLLFTIESNEIDKKISQLEKEIKQYSEKLNNLSKGHNVYSPIEGTVLKVEVSNEDVVDRSTTLITLADLNGMEVVINVDELDVLKLKIGQEAILKSDVFKDETYTGKISNISLEGNSQNGVTTYSVTISVDDRKQLMSGMNVSVNIVTENKQDILTVPIEALQQTPEGYVVRTKDKDGNVKEVKVEIGSMDKFSVEIISGLNEGDIVLFNLNVPIGPIPNEQPSGAIQSEVMIVQ